MPGLQTAPAREEMCICNQAGARYWATDSNCRETKWFKIFLWQKSDKWTWLDFRDWEARPVKEMDQPKEKKHPTTAGAHMVNQIPIISISSQKGLYDFTFFTFASYSSSHRAGMTKPNIPYQPTPGVISSIRENISLFPSATSWHQWLVEAFLPKWGSLQNGFALLQKYRTRSTVHFQWNSVGSTDHLYCLNNSVTATFPPSKKFLKLYQQSS